MRRQQTFRGFVFILYLLFFTGFLFTAWLTSGSRPFQFLSWTLPARLLNETRNDHRRIIASTETLTLALLEAQLLFVVLMTPAYAAAAIAEEKDRHTLALLLTTELSDDEIVWGKSAARVLFVLSVVLAGVPLLLILRLLGGVPDELLIAGSILTVGTTFLAAAIGINCACHSSDLRTTLVRTYGLVIVLICGFPMFVKLSPFAMLFLASESHGSDLMRLDSPFMRMAIPPGYALVQCAIGCGFLLHASSRLRTHEATAGTAEPTAYPEPPKGRPTPIVFGPSETATRPMPPQDSANPVLWRERHAVRTAPFPILNRTAQWIGAMLGLVAAALFMMGGWQLLNRAIQGLDPDEAHSFSHTSSERPESGGLLVAAGVLLSVLYLIPLCAGITGSISEERNGRTLDCLLVTLIPGQTILRSKVQAHVEHWMVFGVGSVTAIGCAFGAVAGLKLGFAAMVMVLAGFWFATACALWLSVSCATQLRAFWLCLPPVLGTIELPMFVWNLTDWSNPSRAIDAMVLIAVLLTALGGLFWWRAVIVLRRG